MSKFAVGDVVYVTRGVQTQSTVLQHKCGTIKHIKEGTGQNIGIEFTQNVGGHDLGGHCLNGYGYYVTQQDIQKMVPASEAFVNYWQREWEPKLKKRERRAALANDPVILIEE